MSTMDDLDVMEPEDDAESSGMRVTEGDEDDEKMIEDEKGTISADDLDAENMTMDELRDGLAELEEMERNLQEEPVSMEEEEDL